MKNSPNGAQISTVAPKILARFSFVALIMSLLILQGCVAYQTFSNAARSGDTVSLAVGSVDGMTKSNTTAQFVSDVDGSVTDLTIRSILKLRPDNTSYIGTFDTAYTGNIEYYSSHSPWLSTLVIDLPAGLTVGTGKININTSGATYIGTNINSFPIAIEILPGAGSPNEFAYNDGFGRRTGYLTNLEPLPQVVVRPPVISQGWYNAPQYAGAKIKLYVPVQKTGGGEILPLDLKVIQDDMYVSNSGSQNQMSWTRTGDEITVNFVSPTGQMKFYQTRFSVVLKPGNEFITSPGPVLNSVNYYDTNGNVVVADTPTLSDFSITLE